MLDLLTSNQTSMIDDGVAADPDDVFLWPTSFAQQRLWFIDQLESGSPFHNISGAFRIEGRLDVCALSYAFNRVVERHEVLRTIFPNVDGEPMQAVLAEIPTLQIALIDLGDVAKEKQDDLALMLARDESRVPFDLMSWPLLRVSLLRLTNENHILLVTVHHIISDGWSMGLMIREVSKLYTSCERSEESGLEELEIQYADYAAWQRENVNEEREREELEYWTGQLAGQESVEPARDRVRPAVQSYRGGRERLDLSEELTEGLKRVSRQAGVTLFTTMLAALRVVLWRCSGQTHSIIGTPIAGRNRREVENLIGLFINTLALSAELSEKREFIEQLRIERDVCFGAYAHQEVAFHKVVEHVQPDRSLSHTPIFQVMFALQNTPSTPVLFSDLRLTRLELENGFTLVDLAVLLSEEGDRVTGSVRYNADIYNKDTIRRLISQYLQVLSEIAEDPARPLWQLGRLSASERQLILHQFNDTATSFPSDLSVCDLFLEQVRTRPTAIALVDGDEKLTYEQLNRRANRVAHYLVAKGVAAESVVGISLERGSDLIVGLLAILKAGCAYLPLDPNHPSRLRQMVADAAARIVIIGSKHRDVLRKAAGDDVELLLIDDPEIDLENEDNPHKRAQADNLCYIIFTSGSTGVPKGVMIKHSSLTNLVGWHIQRYAVTHRDVATLLARQGFDASVWELWPYLCAGAKLVVCDEQMSRSGAGLSEWIAEQGITISFMATPLAEAVMADEALATSKLRYLLTGGDRLKKYAPANGSYKLVNHYGPTESTVVTTGGEVLDQVGEKSRGPSIGKPIDNTRVYILDERLEPVNIGVDGELCVSGEGLARGYTRRAGLTAERFIPDPFAATPGERMYRTGDICRWTSAGEIEFIGRRDNQVKIRGYRLELGEIETAALRSDWVAQAVVVLAETPQLGKQLVGFYVAKQHEEQSRDLGTELSERIPEYMKAARWERLEKLPLNANGKVDRRELEQRALTLLEKGREAEAAAQEREAAMTPIEEIVAGTWEEVLGVLEIGLDENFFEVGGHSLLATQVVTRIKEAVGVDIAVREVFEGATIREISEKIEAKLRQGESKDQTKISRASRDRPLPLSFAQERFRFLEMLQPGTSVYHMPVAVRLTGNLNVPALEKSLHEVRRRHEILRTRFAHQGEQAVQIIEPAQDEPLLIVDLSQVDDEQRDREVKKLIRQQANTKFDLAAGKLVRSSLLKVSSIDHVLVVVMHHIISDGWSMGVMIREVNELYTSYEHGEGSDLEELDIQYADYATWQRENVNEERAQEELKYWTVQLAGQESLELPADRVRPAVPSYRGGRERLELSEELTEGLKRISREAGVTLFMTLLATFKTLLYRYSGQEDISIGTLIAGRNRIETEKLIGLFINALVLRTDFSGGPSFSELLKRVREVTLGAYMHQDLPFERLVDHLRVERDMSRAPLFQVLFLYQNAPMKAFELPGITLTPLEYYNGAVGYDLMLSVSDQDHALNIRLEYSKDLFADETIKRMLKHYSTLLKGIVADPEARICELQLLEEDERKQLLVDWNGAGGPYPLHESFTRLFELQVKSTPDAIAVTCEGESITYQELNERANRLGWLLADFGIRPESTVALCARRSAEFLIALLAIFKSGGAYLPLDPAYPSSRLARVMEQAGCVAVLSGSDFNDNLTLALETMPPALRPNVYVIDDLLARESSIENLSQSMNPNTLAYTIFTSGSTGVPKGAMIEQAGMINHLYAKITALGLSQADVVAQTASQCFDISVWQFLACLLVGGHVHVVSDEAVHDPSLLLKEADERGITVLEVVPTLLRAIVDEAQAPASDRRKLSALRWMIPTGEALAPELARQWLNVYPQISMVNAYGPTECSDDVTHYRIDSPPAEGIAQVPIGRPIPNIETYVLDRLMLPVPVGVTGELYVGGVGVGRGYANDPAKTSERFLPSPFGQRPGARLYKTGDLARYLPDGNLEYLGRIDEQVKVRGFRIETGEVEAALCLNPAIRAAVVAARTDTTGNKYLVAYLAPAENASQEADEIVAALTPALRTFLKERLPEYMVPAQFIGLESFPKTSNGKIDHKALARLKAPASPVEQVIVAPQTSTEKNLVEIWKQVLEINQVSIQDRFLDIGGDSMRIIRAFRALSELYPDKLTVADLFKYNTIESLGTFIDASIVIQQPAVIQGYEL